MFTFECIYFRWASLSSTPCSKGIQEEGLSFRLDLAMGLVSSFHSRKRTGHPRSGEYSDIQRMDLQRGHWPVGIKRKAECVVCSKKRAKLHLQRSDCRHESRVICSYCDVHLCIDEDRKCFMKCHTDIQYWL